MDYKEKYNKALERAKYALTTDMDNSGHWAVNYIFPELKEESNDPEKIRKALKRGFFEYGNSFETFGGITVGDIIAWLEDQDKTDKSLYIRFGDIPINGKSKVYNGEIETGIEEGISVYPAFEDKEGNIILGLNLPITKTSLYTQQHLLEYESRPCYLVTGDYVGKGSDGEPLLKNVKIIKEIKPYRINQDKENNTYTINNTPNCGISVYNEEPKKSGDEREELILYLKGNLKGMRFTTVEGAEQVRNWIAWLEKQGEKPQGKSALEAIKDEKVNNQNCVKSAEGKVESKFKEGDYIVPNNITSPEIWKVINIDEDCYYNIQPITNIINTEDDEIYRVPGFIIEEDYHLWAIQDAKNGDVLVNGSNIFIFRFINHTRLMGYCHVNINDGRFYDDTGKNECFCLIDAEVTPATKEQRDLLFSKMKEAGYEWRQEEKKIIKMKETKFKVGDWVVNSTTLNLCHILKVEHGQYICDDCSFPITHENEYHLWTIQDAKKGDVLASGDVIFIFNNIHGVWVRCHCSLRKDGSFKDRNYDLMYAKDSKEVYPATKEQRDLLFEKMKEAGYEWDADKKELSKQTLQITPKFCVGQVITDGNGTWYKIKNIKCLEYYELYDACEDTTHLELCSIIDEKFRENRFVGEIKKMMGD